MLCGILAIRILSNSTESTLLLTEIHPPQPILRFARGQALTYKSLIPAVCKLFVRNFQKDGEIIDKVLKNSDFDQIFINGDSYVKGYKVIESEFKALMGG